MEKYYFEDTMSNDIIYINLSHNNKEYRIYELDSKRELDYSWYRRDVIRKKLEEMKKKRINTTKGFTKYNLQYRIIPISVVNERFEIAGMPKIDVQTKIAFSYEIPFK